MNGLKSILRYALLAGIFLVPLIPFVVTTSMFFPFITGKNFAFRILAEILFAGWILLALLDARYRPRFSWILASIAAFVGIIALADFFGENSFKSFWSNFERMEGLITLIHLGLYTLVAATVLNTKKLWERLFQTSIGVSVVLVGFGLLQLAGVFTINQGGDRLDATFGNATYLAIYMLFHIFLTALLFVWWRGNTAVRYLYGAIIVLQTVILFFTGTRGTILGLIGGIFLAAAIITFFGRSKRYRNIGIGVFAGVILLVGGFIASKNTDIVQDNFILRRFASISLEEGQTRFTIWGLAWQGFQERPILGWGQENFNYVFNKYYKPELYDQEPWFDRVHNIIFDWLIAGGILGFLAYFAMPISLVYYLWLRRSEIEEQSVTEKGLLTGLLGGYYFHNLFVFDNLISYILFFSILAYVHAISVQHSSQEGDDTVLQPPVPQESSRVTLAVGTPISIVVLIVALYAANVPGIQASRTLINAFDPTIGIDKNLELFEKATSYNTVGRQETREQFIQAASSVSRGNAPPEIKQAFLDSAAEAMQEEIDRVPNDARLQILMASLFTDFNLYDRALPYIERAVELSPNKQQIRFKLGEYYIAKEDFDQAVSVFRDAYELDTSYSEALDLYVTALYFAGEFEQADELLLNHYGTVAVNNNRLLNVYVQVGLFDRVLEIWKLRAAADPENAQTHLSLGAAYFAVGDRDEAIREIQRAIELEPGFREQGEFLIQEIRAGRNILQ